MDFDLENIEERKHEKDSRVTKVLNKNLEEYQYPRYDEYKSLQGFSNMNYSRVKQSARDMQYMKNDRPECKESIDQLYQMQFKSDFFQEEVQIKPFQQVINNSRHLEHNLDSQLVSIKQPSILGGSVFQLANSSLEKKVEMTQKSTNLGYFPPNGRLKQLVFEAQALPSVDSIQYTLIEQDETNRHHKSLSHKVITESSLQGILNLQLLHLNLLNHHWIPMNLISKIGFLAKNVQQLNLGGLGISDEVLIELSISCRDLSHLDISSCEQLTSNGVYSCLSNMTHNLVQLSLYSLSNSVTSHSISPLALSSKLQHLNLGYCNPPDKHKLPLKEQLATSQCQLISLELSRQSSIEPADIIDIVLQSGSTLTNLDVSYIHSNDLHRQFMTALHSCPLLQILDMTACSQISDESFLSLLINERPSLMYLNLCGLKDISEQSLVRLCNQCPNLKLLNCNGLIKLSDQSLMNICKLATKLQILNINNTPHVDPDCVRTILQNRTQSQIPIQILKHEHKMVDPKNNGLLMPYISTAKQNALIKVKKKKKKK